MMQTNHYAETPDPGDFLECGTTVSDRVHRNPYPALFQKLQASALNALMLYTFLYQKYLDWNTDLFVEAKGPKFSALQLGN